jgi:TPR repeat protein
MRFHSILVRPVFAALLLLGVSSASLAQALPLSVDALPQLGIDVLESQAAGGDAGAALIAARLLSAKDRPEADQIAAVALLQQASDAGIIEATIRLADTLRRGAPGIAIDEARAAALYEKAANAGSYPAMAAFADMLRKGRGVEANVEGADTLSAIAERQLPPSSRTPVEQLEQMVAEGSGPAALALGRQLAASEMTEADHRRAVLLLQQASDAGVVEASLRLGDIYRTGMTGVPAEPERAVEFYELAVASGDVQAQLALGSMLRDGKLIAQDLPRAVTLLQAAADDGNLRARQILADMYASGEGVAIDAERAVAYYLAALTDRSPVKALGSLAELFREGTDGLAADPQRAAGYYRAAADLGDAAALRSFAEMQLAGEGMAADQPAAIATLEKLAESDPRQLVTIGNYFIEGKLVPADTQRAIGYFERAAALGDGSALTRLADLYARGAPGLEADPAKAYGTYMAAAEAGSIGAFRKAATMLARGEGVPQDLALATSQLEAVGDSSALLLLGDFYSRGEVTTPDPQRAIGYYEAAAANGSAGAFGRLGDLYRSGAPGLTADGAMALSFYEQAAAAGDAGAQRSMATMLLDGRLVPTDRPRAVELLQASLGAGNAQAGIDLGNLFARGTLGQADFELATAAFDAASASGSANAVVRKAVAVLGGPLATAHGGDVLEELRDAAAANVPSAALELAKLMVTGKVPGSGPGDAIAVLETASTEPAAVRYLLQLYRDGIRNKLSAQPERAAELLSSAASVLAPEVVQVERVLLNAKLVRFQDMATDFLTLPASQGPGTLSRLRSINANAYVYAVQAWLAETGRSDGALSGTLTASTIRAFNGICAEAGRATECRRGPLSTDAAKVIGEFIFAQPAARTAGI